MRFGILFSALAAILAGQSANGTAYEGERLAMMSNHSGSSGLQL
jgi:hypothetical protein